MSDTVGKKKSKLATFGGLALAGMGVAHYVTPQVFETITKPAFPRNTRQHVYLNGGIETALGLGISSPKTRTIALVGTLGYLAYLGGSAARNAR